MRMGMGHPAVVIPATSDEAIISIVLRDLDAAPTADDLTAGLLVNTLQPGLVTRPTVALLKPDIPPSAATTASAVAIRDFPVRLAIRGLFPFGDSTVPILYRGRQVESLRFSKPGLILKSAGDEGYTAREGEPFPLVLVNPSGAEYKTVRARLRFLDTDLCAFAVEEFAPPRPKGPDDKPATQEPDCNSYPGWASFSVPRYADVTLRAVAPSHWFREPGSGVARDSKRHGLLTLRFESQDVSLIHEQNLSFDVAFRPARWSIFRSLLSIAACLAAGAGLSLLLRVSVPNIKRKRALKDQLDDLGDITRSVSTEVNSTLRVLLRVDRLALEEIRQSAWVFGPGYIDAAVRVEQAVPGLKRRIEAVRRLDATLARKRLFMGQNPAPTRLDQVESHLEAASETLKQDNLNEEDWVFVNQHLEAAQKFLREPTQAEEDAFSALLSGRWKSIKAHFDSGSTGTLGVPPGLEPMAKCFPGPLLLPQAAGDPDGTQWIQSVGTTRADLQLYALTLVRDFEFLVPDKLSDADTRWKEAMVKLADLLATPAVENLREAKSLLRQLAERIDAPDVEAALANGMAMIQMDPAIPRPNQRIRFSVRFWDERLNLAAARDLFSCRWSFADNRISPNPFVDRTVLASGAGAVRMLYEDGWSVHHYFESDVGQSRISVSFRNADGTPVKLDAPAGSGDALRWYDRMEVVQVSRRSRERWARAWLETIQLTASLLVPLATLASQTLNGGSVGDWWQLVAIGFASDTIKNILVGRQES